MILAGVIAWYLVCATGGFVTPDHQCVSSPRQAMSFATKEQAEAARKSGETLSPLVQNEPQK